MRHHWTVFAIVLLVGGTTVTSVNAHACSDEVQLVLTAKTVDARPVSGSIGVALSRGHKFSGSYDPSTGSYGLNLDGGGTAQVPSWSVAVSRNKGLSFELSLGDAIRAAVLQVTGTDSAKRVVVSPVLDAIAEIGVELHVKLEAGTLLRPRRLGAQTMVASGRVRLRASIEVSPSLQGTLRFDPDAKQEYELETWCTDIDKLAPTSSDPLVVVGIDPTYAALLSSVSRGRGTRESLRDRIWQQERRRALDSLDCRDWVLRFISGERPNLVLPEALRSWFDEDWLGNELAGHLNLLSQVQRTKCIRTHIYPEGIRWSEIQPAWGDRGPLVLPEAASIRQFLEKQSSCFRDDPLLRENWWPPGQTRVIFNLHKYGQRFGDGRLESDLRQFVSAFRRAGIDVKLERYRLDTFMFVISWPEAKAEREPLNPYY